MKQIIAIFSFIFIIISCKETLPIEDTFGNNQYNLLTQDSVRVNFPQLIKGKISVVGYIFTNCPDICPLTTNNMRLIQQKLNKENIEDVEFVSISFDPDVDKPEVLKKYIELRRLDTSNWTFLTGEKNVITMLMKDANIVAVISDSTVIEEKKMYFYVHTDRISLIDAEGNIRKNYPGSKVNVDEVLTDLKTLID